MAEGQLMWGLVNDVEARLDGPVAMLHDAILEMKQFDEELKNARDKGVEGAFGVRKVTIDSLFESGLLGHLRRKAESSHGLLALIFSIVTGITGTALDTVILFLIDQWERLQGWVASIGHGAQVAYEEFNEFLAVGDLLLPNVWRVYVNGELVETVYSKERPKREWYLLTEVDPSTVRFESFAEGDPVRPVEMLELELQSTLQNIKTARERVKSDPAYSQHLSDLESFQRMLGIAYDKTGSALKWLYVNAIKSTPGFQKIVKDALEG